MSISVRLHLSADQAEILRQAAAAAYPHECCGLLVGEGESAIVITEIVPTPNTADDPRRAFSIDPQAQFDLLRRVRDGKGRVVGHYHSHPNGKSELSSHDRAMAHDPATVWIVMPVADARAGAPRAYRCTAADAVAEMAIDVS